MNDRFRTGGAGERGATGGPGLYAIVRIITEEDLAIGDRLPSESRLAETFGMSRTIVREALARLASDGITEARRGAGSYVKRRPSARLGSHMPMDALAATLGTYEVRFVLEAEAARLAAQRRSPEQMDAIEAALAALRTALLSNAPRMTKTGCCTVRSSRRRPMPPSCPSSTICRTR